MTTRTSMPVRMRAPLTDLENEIMRVIWDEGTCTVEWVRFDAPGKYRLKISSHRVANVRHEDVSAVGAGGETVTSNVLELTIIPATKDWLAGPNVAWSH